MTDHHTDPPSTRTCIAIGIGLGIVLPAIGYCMVAAFHLIARVF